MLVFLNFCSEFLELLFDLVLFIKILHVKWIPVYLLASISILAKALFTTISPIKIRL